MCMWGLVLQPKIFMTVSIRFIYAALTHPQQQIWDGSHAKHLVLLKGLLLYNNTHKRNMFHYNITVPPGGQTVLFPQRHRMFFPFISIYQLVFLRDNLEISSKSNIFISSVAVWCVVWEGCRKKSVQHESSRARRKKERMWSYCIQAICQSALSGWKNIKVVFC